MKQWLNIQWEWMKGFLSEENGKASQKRLVSFLIAVVFVFNYNRIAWQAKELLDVPPTWAMLLAGIIGLAIAANAVANKKPEPAP
jgi:hypothetical protein